MLSKQIILVGYIDSVIIAKILSIIVQPICYDPAYV